MTLVGSALLLLGALVTLIAALGAVRMPDVLTRLHAITKAGSLGVALIVIATPMLLDAPETLPRAIAIVVFAVLTAPISAHMISRAAHYAGIELFSGTLVDELAEDWKKGAPEATNAEDEEPT